MIAEISLYGVYFPALFALSLVAFAVLWVVRRLFAQIGLYRLVWHPALFDLALFVVLLYAVSTLFFHFFQNTV